MTQFVRRAFCCVFTASILFGCREVSAQAPQKPAAAQALWSAHLLEQARYGESADAIQSLIGTDLTAVCGVELRGTLALYVGHITRAHTDFQTAIAMAPDDPSGHYGIGLCALFDGDLDRADRHFARAQKCPDLTTQQTEDIELASAYVAFLRGDLTKAETIIRRHPDSSDASHQLLGAVLANRRDASRGASLLKAFLENPNGVPRVREEDGIRMRFETAPAMLEPSVPELPLRKMYQIRLDSDIRDANRGVKAPGHVSGITTVQASVPQDNTQALVSFYIDGQFESVVNSAPYVYKWDTSEVANGRHRVRIDTSNAAGAVLQSQTLVYDVTNKNSSAQSTGHGTLTSEEYKTVSDRIWGLLRLRPARKVAEVLLAEDLEQAGDRDDANLHRAIAAAIDPNYKNGRAFLHRILGAQLVGKPNTSDYNDLWQGSIKGNRIALTFDDGPNAVKTPALLDALSQAKVPATFFVVGSRAELAPELIKRMAAMGDEVENHSYTHPNMEQSLPASAEAEILRNSVLIRILSGRFPHFFRPPGGNAGPMVEKLTRAYGLINAYWTIDVLRAEDEGSPTGLVQFVMKRLHPGAIILLHNGSDVTTSAIPALVTALHARGYKCVRLSEIGYAPPSGKKNGKTPRMKE